MADKQLTMNLTGILAGVRPCGIIVLLAELFRAESKAQVYANLHEFMRKHPHVSENIGKCVRLQVLLYVIQIALSCFLSLPFLSTEYVCYDDGCHLRKYAQHSTRRNVTPTAQRLSNIEIVIDKLHMEGHTDKWCKDNCDPHLFRALDNVSTWMYFWTATMLCIDTVVFL